MRPRGLPSQWVKITPWYYTERKQRSRLSEMRDALTDDYKAYGEHSALCRPEPWNNHSCPGFYLEYCGDDRCFGCVPLNCRCRCHEADASEAR